MLGGERIEEALPRRKMPDAISSREAGTRRAGVVRKRDLA